jgi:hypothetical protein
MIAIAVGDQNGQSIQTLAASFRLYGDWLARLQSRASLIWDTEKCPVRNHRETKAQMSARRVLMSAEELYIQIHHR